MLWAELRLVASGIVEVEPIIHPGLHHIDGAGIEFHSVVFELHRPIFPEGIFGADADHPSADRIAKRNRPTTQRAHGAESAAAAMRPGGAELAVDEPAIECEARPPSERGDPVEAPFRARSSDNHVL